LLRHGLLACGLFLTPPCLSCRKAEKEEEAGAPSIRHGNGKKNKECGELRIEKIYSLQGRYFFIEQPSVKFCEAFHQRHLRQKQGKPC